jgi:hypothetical protein
MRLLVTLLLLFATLQANAEVTSIKCDSFMKAGFYGANEAGVLTFTKSPFSVSIQIPNKKKVVITDADHFCLESIDKSQGAPSFEVLEENSPFFYNLFFGAKRTTTSGMTLEDDLGSLWIRYSHGGFFCSKLGETIDLGYCSVKSK